jgi:glyoxylase-like metal-dependent hydrolase (beta-lactamase superfamily II)
MSDKPVRYIMNTHPHSDHTRGLPALVAEGATIITHENNAEFFERDVAQLAAIAVGPSVRGPLAALPCPPSTKSGSSCDCGLGNPAISSRVSPGASVSRT